MRTMIPNFSYQLPCHRYAADINGMDKMRFCLESIRNFLNITTSLFNDFAKELFAFDDVFSFNVFHFSIELKNSPFFIVGSTCWLHKIGQNAVTDNVSWNGYHSTNLLTTFLKKVVNEGFACCS